MTPKFIARSDAAAQWTGDADTAFGSADNLAWLVKQKQQITPYIPVCDKSNRRRVRAFDPDANC